MKYRSLLFLFLIIVSPMVGKSQPSVKEMIETKRFVFKAESLTPLKGSMRTLTPGYTLKVSPDTIVCDLPYIGRSYQAVYGSNDGGIKFEATKFEYSVKQKKKGWTVNIATRAVSGSPRVIISVFENGTARVVITPTDKESITYNGTVSGE